MCYLKNKLLVSISLLLIPFFYSCSKVINVDINNTSPLIVITGEVNNLPGPYIINISKSVNYTTNNIYPPVSGGFVTITGNGITDTLAETTPGAYASHFLKGIAGGTYSLYVSVEGQVYTATSVMPNPVQLDTISFTTRRNNSTINAVVHFQDPLGISNYYHFIEYNNNKQFNNNRGWSVIDDRLSDGRYINNTLDDDSTDIKTGDILTVRMNCIDKKVYDYLYTLSQISNSNRFNSPSPSNPVSNISNGALGYFTANTTQTKRVVVP